MTAPRSGATGSREWRLIVRVWAGRAKPGLGNDYLAHLEAAVLPDIRSLPGNLGAQVLREAGEGEESFVVLTYWTDLGAVEAFSGPDPGAAVVPSEARNLLSEYDSRVRHFHVVHDSKGS